MKRISFLDGAKGICALLVLIAHFAMAFRYVSNECDVYLSRNCFQFLASKTAVFIFIIISVYLCLIQITEKPINNIILKRYFRLAIPTAIALIFLFVLKITGLLFNHNMPDGNPWLIQDAMDYKKIGYAILESPFGQVNGWLNAVWMLGYILYGTYMAIIAKFALDNIKPIWKICILLFFAIVVFHFDIIWLNFIYAFLIYIYLQSFSTPQKDKYVLIFSILGLAVLDFLPRREIPNLARAFCLINILFCSKGLKKILSLNLFTFLGEISFSIYLLQLPIIYSLSCYLWLKGYNIWFITAITFSVVIVLSTFVTKYIEKPLNRKLNAFCNWIRVAEQ